MKYGKDLIVDEYILLTPGEIHKIKVDKCYFEEREISGFCDRWHKISKEVENGFRWQKPVSPNSQEFKDWKARILSLIEEARQSAMTKSSLSP